MALFQFQDMRFGCADLVGQLLQGLAAFLAQAEQLLPNIHGNRMSDLSNDEGRWSDFTREHYRSQRWPRQTLNVLRSAISNPERTMPGHTKRNRGARLPIASRSSASKTRC